MTLAANCKQIMPPCFSMRWSCKPVRMFMGGKKEKEFSLLQLNQFGSTQTSYFIALPEYEFPFSCLLCLPSWSSWVQCSVCFCIVIFSVEGIGLESVPSRGGERGVNDLSWIPYISGTIQPFLARYHVHIFLREGAALAIFKAPILSGANITWHLWRNNGPWYGLGVCWSLCLSH